MPVYGTRSAFAPPSWISDFGFFQWYPSLTPIDSYFGDALCFDCIPDVSDVKDSGVVIFNRACYSKVDGIIVFGHICCGV